LLLGLTLTDILAADRQSSVPAAPVSRVDNNDSLVQSWTGPNIRALIRSPEVRRMHERWMSLGEKKLPRLNEALGPEPQVALNNAMLLLHLPDDFAFVHHGAAAVKLIGTNLTGMLLSERKNAIANAVRKVYANCIEAAQPFYVRHVAAVSSHQHFFIEQIALPIAADERRAAGFVLVYSAPLDDKNEVLKTIFERSQIGMIAAASNHDETGKLQDGRILLINERARKVLKLPEAMDLVQTVRDLGPWFRDGAAWTKTTTVSEGKQTHIHYRDQAGTSYRVTVEPIDRFVLFSIIEIPVIK
jgi:PAS domain-containing protein